MGNRTRISEIYRFQTFSFSFALLKFQFLEINVILLPKLRIPAMSIWQKIPSLISQKHQYISLPFIKFNTSLYSLVKNIRLLSFRQNLTQIMLIKWFFLLRQFSTKISTKTKLKPYKVIISMSTLIHLIH